MLDKSMTIGIFPNLNKEIVRSKLNYIIESFKSKKINVILHSGENIGFIKENAKLLLILGGDGTFLKAFSIYKDSIPFLGINFGKFGFLSYSELSNLERLISSIKDEDYKTSKRVFIKVQVNGGEREKIFYALNEATLIRDISSRLIEVPIYIDEVKIGPVPCDGILVSTPTGYTCAEFLSTCPR
jgi:NAD+ kinase